jgi:hypothetical protein
LTGPAKDCGGSGAGGRYRASSSAWGRAPCTRTLLVCLRRHGRFRRMRSSRALTFGRSNGVAVGALPWRSSRRGARLIGEIRRPPLGHGRAAPTGCGPVDFVVGLSVLAPDRRWGIATPSVVSSPGGGDRCAPSTATSVEPARGVQPSGGPVGRAERPADTLCGRVLVSRGAISEPAYPAGTRTPAAGGGDSHLLARQLSLIFLIRLVRR